MFRPSFWRETDIKWFLEPQGQIGHPKGRRQQGLGGVHQVGDLKKKKKNLTDCKSFRPSFWQNSFKYLRELLDTMVYVDIKDKEEYIK